MLTSNTTGLQLFGKFRQLGRMILPVHAVELTDVDLLDRAGIQAARIDAVAVGVGTRDVKRFDAANPAKQMFGDSGVECICRQVFVALK